MNVSEVTVSKALNDHPEISVETKNRIKIFAHELGYIPNYFAKICKSNQSKMIGVILPNLNNTYYTALIEAIYKEAFEQGYEIIFKVSYGNHAYEIKLLELLLSMRVDGIIITSAQDIYNNSIFKLINKLGVSLTFLESKNVRKGCSEISTDYFQSAYTATEIAIKKGYRKFLYISENKDQYFFKNGFLGFQTALKDHNCPVTDYLTISDVCTDKTAYDIFVEHYKSGMIPDCVFCSSLQIGSRFYKIVNDIGMKVPDSIDFIISGHHSIEHFFVQPLAYIEQPIHKLGTAAVKITINNILENCSLNSIITSFPIHVRAREPNLKTKQNVFRKIFKYPLTANPGILTS